MQPAGDLARAAVADPSSVHLRHRQYFLRRVRQKTFLGAGEVAHGQPCFSRRNSRLASQLQKDRKSTRLNSSHGYISYAVFCLKKKKKKDRNENAVNLRKL